MGLIVQANELPEVEVRCHYEFLKGWLSQVGCNVQYLTMPDITVHVVSRDRFAELTRRSAERDPRGFEEALLEEYGEVRSVDEVAREAVGSCFGPYGRAGQYLITMRDDYTDPELYREILHVFEGQLGIQRGSLEERFKQYLKRHNSYDDSQGPHEHHHKERAKRN
jgi:hypothetical protein